MDVNDLQERNLETSTKYVISRDTYRDLTYTRHIEHLLQRFV